MVVVPGAGQGEATTETFTPAPGGNETSMLEEAREVESIKRFLDKCNDRGVEISLTDDGIEVMSVDPTLVEPTQVFIAKHEVAFLLVLTEQIMQKQAATTPGGTQDAADRLQL